MYTRSKLTTTIILAVFIFLSFSAFPVQAATANPCGSNLNNDTIVDISDYGILVSSFLKVPPPNPKADINKDGIVDIEDYTILANSYLMTCNQSSSSSGASAIRNAVVVTTGQIPLYEKYEVHFDVVTNSQYPYVQYDTNPPLGVSPGIGITVNARIRNTATGKEVLHPAFYMTEVTKTSGYYVETNKKYWAIRYSPTEAGTYEVTLTAQDASGTTSYKLPTNFTATAPTKKGFVQVSNADKRYFEYSNGNLFFPTGPANQRNGSYNLYQGSGANIARPWLGGRGIYSTNWARWKSSGELHGNEGHKASLSWQEKYPGHDLSYKIIYNTDTSKGPNGFRTWITSWLDDANAGRITSGKRYQVKLVFKATKVTGPRNSSSSNYGFVIRAADSVWGADGWSPDQWDATLRNSPAMAPTGGGGYFTNTSNDSRCASINSGWCTYTTTFTAPKNQDSFYLYLENVTAGEVYIDEFSVKEIDGSGNIIGGEVIRNAVADQHMYFEQRPAAELDDMLTNADQNGVTLKLVVHDKNDWIQNHLKPDGTWTDTGSGGYYQSENTKARWLLRQWYRYLAARWGYSTAVHTFELNNEGPPNEEGGGTAAHWRTAQEFAKYIHQVYPARRILATTSFWCCWRPNFWGNSTSFPDVDYADFHMYLSNIENNLIPASHQFDFALWTNDTSINTYNLGYPSGQKGVGKPNMLAETGIDTGTVASQLSQSNPGYWFHNMIWAQLNHGAMSNPLYWHDEHLLKMTPALPDQIKPFYLFVKDLNLNKGGYSDIAATSTNTKLRMIGQKNVVKNEAHLWIQNTDHTWKKYADGVRSNQTGTVQFSMSPNRTYTVEWWDTYTGAVKQTQTVTSNASGLVTLSVSNLPDDIAVKLR